MLEQYLDVASTLRVSEVRRVVCCKANKKTALVSRTAQGATFHCFRCGAHGYMPMRLTGEAARKPEHRNTLDVSGFLPLKDAATTIETNLRHARALAWVLRYGLSVDTLTGFNVRITPHGHVAVPCWRNGVFMVRRVGATSGPKWICTSTQYSPSVFYVRPLVDRSRVVVVEDPVSAMKIAAALPGTHAVSINGTHSGAWVDQIPPQGSRVTVWMDDDPAGQSASRKVASALTLQGYDVRIPCIPPEFLIQGGSPKDYSPDCIKYILCLEGRTYD